MKIIIGSDHAGYHYKEKIKPFLKEKGHEVYDFGTNSDNSVDYPLIVRPVARAVARGEYDRGIVLGGSGNGEAMVANRTVGIRCALCWSPETARLARTHNDANMLSLGERMISLKDALEIVQIWLETAFDGGRHLRRINQIDEKPPVTDHPGRPEKDKKRVEQKTQGALKPSSARSDRDPYDLLITFRYIKYMEGKDAIEFQVDPGLKRPSIIHIPSPERWNSELPEWVRNRREEILERVKSKCAHMDSEWKEY